MKILHVITSLYTGGAEKLISDIVPMMIARGHNVEVALFDGTDTPFKQSLIDSGVRIHSFSIGKSAYNPLNILKLNKLMRQFDIVHTHNTAPQLFAAIGSILRPVALCTTEHNTSNRRRAWRSYAFVDRWMYGRYRHIICISPGTELNLRKYVGEINIPISTVYNGIDLHKFQSAIPVDLDKESNGCQIALMQVAGFRYQKDQDTVIESLTEIPENIHLYLVGGGVREKELRQITDSYHLNNRVHFMGIRSDVDRLIKAADIVVMSSHWEGFGLAAVEGMAAGKPVIASDVDGLRDVVGGAGILFPHQDYKKLASEIINLANNPNFYDEVVSKCRRRAMKYSLSNMVDKYEMIYQCIYNKKHK